MTGASYVLRRGRLTHDQETNADCLRDPDELLLVGLWTVH